MKFLRREKKEQPPYDKIIRYHKKCGCVSLYIYKGFMNDLFDIQLCPEHGSKIIDRYED